jgi:HEPN domain-containing protein
MSDIERTDADRWLKFAADDLHAAETIFAAKHLPHRLVCFHCQQSAEKSLKGLLIYLKIDFPKTHDLNLLKRLVPDGIAAKQDIPDMSELTVFAAESRYPGDFPEAGGNNATDAIRVAERVLDLVLREMRSGS